MMTIRLPAMMGLVTVAVVAGLVLVADPAAAQHETDFDVVSGARAYESSCANCHGPDGDQIAGVDLGHGQFRRASSDEDLLRIMREGIPDTTMPPARLRAGQAEQIVAYLRSLAASSRSESVAGDVGRGRALFEGTGNCSSCHRVAGAGSRLGPNLTDIGSRRRAVDLEQSLLDPAAEVLAQHRFYRVVTRDGEDVTGRLLNLDTFTVQLLDADERLRSFEKSGLSVHGFVERTSMPSYRDQLSPQELADVVAYLVSLKGGSN